MKYRATIRPEAENDLKEAFSWYEDKRQGLAHDFLLQVDAADRNPAASLWSLRHLTSVVRQIAI